MLFPDVSKICICPGFPVVTYMRELSSLKYISRGTPALTEAKSNASAASKFSVLGFHVAVHRQPPYMLVTDAIGGFDPGTNRTSTGASRPGSGFLETRKEPSAVPVEALITLMLSPASPRSEGRTVDVTKMRSIPL